MKKQFNVTIDEDKIKLLKKFAIDEGKKVSELIEHWIEEGVK